jgi:hypothetical protein
MMALVMPVPLVLAIGYGDSGWGYLFFIPKFIQNDRWLCKRSIKMASDIKLIDNAVVVEGNIGIGTTSPGRQLHVQGNEIHSGGPGAGFSFSDRTSPGLVNMPQNGERWVWYASEKAARLWSNVDHIVVRPNVNDPNQPASVYIPGELLVSGRIVADDVQADVRFLVGAPDKATDNSPIELVVVKGDTISLSDAGGRNKYLALHAAIDTQAGKAVLVINHLQGYKDGVRIEGNVQVTGALTHASSIALKENVTQLSLQEALATLQALQAVTFNYKADAQKTQHAGFIAEQVPDLVAKSERQAVGSMDIVAVLTKVVQEQQRLVAELAAKVEHLAATLLQGK